MKQGDYPLILEPGALRKLNDDAIRVLGTPVFFYSPETNWPKPADPMARMYVTVTALYQVYHDYGTQILKSFLTFCEFGDIYFWETTMLPQQHIEKIAALRNGLCHGSLPEGRLAQTFQETLQTYRLSWPPASHSACQSFCDRLLPKLVAESDAVLNYLVQHIELISTHAKALPRWREWLVRDVMDPEQLLYSERPGEGRFFGINMVWDLANRYPGEKNKAELSRAVQQWLSDMKPRLLNGCIETSDTLPDTLTAAIQALYEAPRL